VEAATIEEVDERMAFDLILIDAGSLKRGSLLALKEWHELNPQTRFAVMSTSNTRADVLNCLSAGFHGFLYKLQSDDELLTAINDLLSGRIYVPRWLADSDESRSDLPSSIGVRAERLKLTPRQHEILPLLAQGMSNKEIARHLCIAEGTTKIHTAALLRALGARNRTEAAFICAKLVGSTARFDDRFANFVIEELAGLRVRA
jgi:DNA-binding NarL/FixJ family response regulator